MAARSVDPTKPYAAGYNPTFSASEPPDSYEDGGAIEEDPVEQPFKPVQMPQANVMDSQDALDTGAPKTLDDTSASINHALELVDKLLAYGRNKFGIGGANNKDGSGAIPEAPSFEGGGEVEELPIQEPLSDETDTAGKTVAARTMPQQSAVTAPQAPPTTAGPIGAALEAGVNKLTQPAPVWSDQPDAPTNPAYPGGPEAAQPQPATPAEGGGLGQQLSNAVDPSKFAPNAMRFIAWLKGEGDDPQKAAQYKQAAAQQFQGAPADANLMALAMAYQNSPDDGLGVLQNLRKTYDVSRSFAAAALNGNQQRPPNIAAAADAATKASDNLPDGTNLKFVPAGDGVIVTGTKAGTNGRPFLQAQLSKPAFKQWLTGNEGQFDTVMENGSAATIQRLQQQGHGDRIAGGAGMREAPTPKMNPGDSTGTYFAKTKDPVQFGEPNQNQIPSMDSTGIDADIAQRAKLAHPEDRSKMINWAQAAQKLRDDAKGKVEAAQTAATSREKVATGREETSRYVADTRTAGMKERWEGREAAAMQRELLRIASTERNVQKRGELQAVAQALRNANDFTPAMTAKRLEGIGIDPRQLFQRVQQAPQEEPQAAPQQQQPTVAPQQPSRGGFPAPNVGHIQFLKSRPGEAAAFDKKFGPGAAAKALNGAP